MLPWLNGILQGRNDIAVVMVDENRGRSIEVFEQIQCPAESGDETVTGWSCIFGNMAHMCTFHQQQVSKPSVYRTALNCNKE